MEQLEIEESSHVVPKSRRNLFTRQAKDVIAASLKDSRAGTTKGQLRAKERSARGGRAECTSTSVTLRRQQRRYPLLDREQLHFENQGRIARDSRRIASGAICEAGRNHDATGASYTHALNTLTEARY
jgi:hypothetical protein